MQFQPDSIRSLFFCLEDPIQVSNCCSFLNCSKEPKNGPSKGSNSSKCIVNFNKKIVHKKKFKSKKKKSKKDSKSSSSGPKTRSAGKFNQKPPAKSPYDRFTENVSNSLRSFQFQTEQLPFKYQPESFDRDDSNIIKSFESILQDLYFDINNLNTYIAKNSVKNSIRKLTKEEFQEQGENMKPSSSKSSKSKTPTNAREKFLSDSYLVIRLLHLECNLLKYLQMFETLFNVDISILFSSDRFSITNRSLLNLSRVYYLLLTKLNISKSTFLIHSSSKKNASAIFCILSRILNHCQVMSPRNDDEILEIETIESNPVPEIRIKKAARTSSNSDPGKCLSFLMIHLEQLLKRDLYSTNFESGQSLKQVKLNLIGVNRQNTLEFALNSSLVSVLRDLFSQFVLKFKNKSDFRQKIIELLAFVCIKRNGALDAIALGSGFIQDLISLLSLMAMSHAKVVFRDLTSMILSHEPNTPLRAVKKNYLAILKDIYGLLSIFLSFTEFKEGQECLQFHNVAENLYGSFLEPFVEMLNGLEDCDPKHLKIDESLNFNTEPSLAFETLKNTLKEHSKMNRYLDRIVGISNMIIQRLLPTILIPIEALNNPFIFPLPETDERDSQPIVESPMKKAQSRNDYMILDEEIEDENDQESECEYDSSTFSIRDRSDSLDNPLLPSYLQFFPEVDLNSRGAEGCLNCDCSSDFQTPEVNIHKLPINYSHCQQKPQFLTSEKWKENFNYFYDQTHSVMPKVEIPFPESNFVYDNSTRNQPLQSMTYPFLDQIPQKKNYHYIKIVEMIQSRFGTKQTLLKLYDNSVSDLKIDPSIDTEQYLKFDSMFESGNLRAAMVVTSPTKPDEEEYILMLSSDVNTIIHTQWFYFSVSGTKTNKRYRFKIINLQKKSILYNSGQQPAFYSVNDFQSQNQMWQRLRSDSNVAYYRNHYVRTESSRMTDKFFTLEFCFNFSHENDTCYFAYNVPYTYTFLRTNILQWRMLVDQQNSNADGLEENDESAKTFFFVQSLCSTLKGNDLPVLTITSRTNVQSSSRPHYVFVTARVHPSESNSSWVMKGFIDSLIVKETDPVKEAHRRSLLEKYIFKIVPMLNPDGVINGSTRTGLQKVDLNRQWMSPNPLLYPTIYHTKMLMKCLNYHSDGLNPIAYIDLHGHSRQKNIFSYSCSPFSSWKMSDRMQAKSRINAQDLWSCNHSFEHSPCQLKQWLSYTDREPTFRDLSFYFIPPYIMLPFLMYEQRASCFNINDCSFNIQKDRESSGRIVAWRQLNIPLSYTIECSASGMDFGPFSGYHLDISHLEDMGLNLASAFTSLHFLRCSNKHVPVIVLPKISIEDSQPKNDSELKTTSIFSREQIANKLYRKAASKHAKNDPISIKLIDLYSDLNTEVYPICSTATSAVSSATPTPSCSKTATPSSTASITSGSARRPKLRKKSREICNK